MPYLQSIQAKKTAIYGACVAAVVGVGLLVYVTGGIAYVFSHTTAYIPIVLAAIFLGPAGAIVIAVLAGLVLGPYMPIHTETMEMQSTGCTAPSISS